MALKPLRHVSYDTIQYYLNATGERGGVLIYDTSSSGLGDMDDAGSLAKFPTDSGGSPVGVLMCDVVDIDQSRFALNMHQDEVQKNSKVPIAKRGLIRTNMLAAGQNPIPGSGAYYTTNGMFTMNTGSVLCGRFGSAKDSDGYADIELNI